MAGVASMGEDEQMAADQALEMLRNDYVRKFRIDIETDSTVATNDQADRRDFSEYVEVVGQFIQNALPVVEQVPSFGPVVGEILMSLSRKHRAGRSLEDSLKRAIDQAMEQQPQGQPGQEQPDPEQIKQQLTAQIDMQKMQLEQGKLQAKVMEIQTRAQQSERETQAKLAMHAQEIQTKQQQTAAEMQRHTDQMIADALAAQKDRQLKAAEIATKAIPQSFAPSV